MGLHIFFAEIEQISAKLDMLFAKQRQTLLAEGEKAEDIFYTTSGFPMMKPKRATFLVGKKYAALLTFHPGICGMVEALEAFSTRQSEPMRHPSDIILPLWYLDGLEDPLMKGE